MKISVIGTGYVGLVAGTCFADGGNHVICVDNDKEKINTLLSGQVPIYEPGLAEIIQRNTKAGRLEFTTDLSSAVANSLVIFLAVGTPQAEDGSADLTVLMQVVKEIGKLMDGYRIIVTKSTVPVGTHKKVADILESVTDHPFDYVSNPEFMKEGAAIDDFTKPDRVIIGTSNAAVVEIMKQVYAPFMRKHDRILIMDTPSAEMTKYASNALLATKVTFMNEVANLCEKYGADVEKVRTGVGSDSRIGHAFLFPGVGYGGSCFPKDVSASIYMGKQAESPMTICETVQKANQYQRRKFAKQVIDYFADKTSPVTLAVWGLAFKSRTDDIRESPALSAIEMFIENNFTIRAHDPEAIQNTQNELGNDRISYYQNSYEALDNADALVIFTDWPEFRTPDFDAITDKLKQKIIFDGRNLYNPPFMKKLGFEYYCVGRPNIKG
ncbi:MAG: UDP-glucose dehydrogenase family protein [Planctomycetota bacterium]|jgi:UDPglucose 6-dehydrogenase